MIANARRLLGVSVLVIIMAVLWVLIADAKMFWACVLLLAAEKLLDNKILGG